MLPFRLDRLSCRTTHVKLQVNLAALEFAETHRNIAWACRTFSVSRASFYRWKAIYQEKGVEGLRQRKPIAKDNPRRIPEETVAKVIELRTKYHLGQRRIVWYMQRYHGIRISQTSVYRILIRNGLRNPRAQNSSRAPGTPTNGLSLGM